MIDIGAALLPDNNVRDLAIQLNKDLQTMHRTSYSLGDEFHPHLSLYQSTFRDYKSFRIAVQGIENLGKYVAEAEIKLRNLIVHPSNFVTFQCHTTDGLQRLHEAILKPASEARLKDASSIWERNNVRFNPEKEENIRKYGYPDALKFYDPHFTIGRVVDKDVNREQIILKLMQKAERYIGYAFRPPKLVIYELGADGGCLNPRE